MCLLAKHCTCRRTLTVTLTWWPAVQPLWCLWWTKHLNRDWWVLALVRICVDCGQHDVISLQWWLILIVIIRTCSAFARSSLSTDRIEHCCQILITTCYHCHHQSTASSLKSMESLLSLEWVLILVIRTVWGCQYLLTAEDKEIELQWHHPVSGFHALGESQVWWSFIDGCSCSGQHSLLFLF